MYSATRDFMNKKGPLNYVAGIGRGASGFTTRSDIGPARDDIVPSDPIALKDTGDNDDEGYGGRGPDDNEEGLLSNLAPYEADDIEADKIYADIDDNMDLKRRSRREAREQEELAKYRKVRPKISQQFEDVKRSLKELSEQDWNNIPEVGDIRAKRMKKSSGRPEQYTPIPDSILQHAQAQAGYVGQLDIRDQQQYRGLTTPINDGFSTPMTSGTATPMADFIQINEARGRQLGHKLDQVSGSVSGIASSVDPTGYLTGLSSMMIKSSAEISDIKKSTALLLSLVHTNPENADGWISLARLEEQAGKISKAKEHITEACQMCPKSEDIWLEAARLSQDQAKEILAASVQRLPQSVKLWMKAAELERDSGLKRKILQRAVENIPHSVKLWKAAIEMEEEEEDALELLAKAIEFIPTSVELWLALASLETYEGAKKALNAARKACPTSHEIWIAAAKLEEANDHPENIDKLINTGVNVLMGKNYSLSREQWIKEAEAAEASESFRTCQAIIRATIGIGVEEQDLKSTLLEDAETVAARGSIQTARAMYAYALECFPNKKSIWKAAAFFERQHGDRASLLSLLSRAVIAVPQCEVLWLMAAKENWLNGDVSAARKVLEEAFKANTNSEQIWLAAVKLEDENGETQRARILLAKAREQADTPRVWMKSAALERHEKNFDLALELLRIAIEKFPTFDKLYMMMGGIYDRLNDENKIRQIYSLGLKRCPFSIPLWRLAAVLELRSNSIIKARPILENARLSNPKTPELWLDAIRIEVKQNNKPMAKSLLAKALQECPHSGLLWSEAIQMEPRPAQKSKGADAWKRCPNDPYVATTLARIFWNERQLDKTRGWFERAIQADPDLGDTWAYAYGFEKQYGTDETRKVLMEKCILAEPHHGEHWTHVSKDIDNTRWTTAEILEKVAERLTA